MNKLHHVVEGRSREENFVHAFASHDCSVLMRDGTAAAAKDPDVASAFAQKSDHFREELDVPAVITGNANGAHVFLDRGADNIADRAMITKIDDLNAVPDELEIDCIDRAVVAVTNWNSGEDANR